MARAAIERTRSKRYVAIGFLLTSTMTDHQIASLTGVWVSQIRTDRRVLKTQGIADLNDLDKISHDDFERLFALSAKRLPTARWWRKPIEVPRPS